MKETYPDAPGYKVEGTSKDSAEAMEGRSAILRVRAIDCLKAHPDGLTADECAELMKETPSRSGRALASFT